MTVEKVDFSGFQPTADQLGCEKCGGSGWINVRKPVDANKTPLLQKCACRAGRK